MIHRETGHRPPVMPGRVESSGAIAPFHPQPPPLRDRKRDTGSQQSTATLHPHLVVAVHQDVRDQRVGKQRLQGTQPDQPSTAIAAAVGSSGASSAARTTASSCHLRATQRNTGGDDAIDDAAHRSHGNLHTVRHAAIQRSRRRQVAPGRNPATVTGCGTGSRTPSAAFGRTPASPGTPRDARPSDTAPQESATAPGTTGNGSPTGRGRGGSRTTTVGCASEQCLHHPRGVLERVTAVRLTLPTPSARPRSGRRAPIGDEIGEGNDHPGIPRTAAVEIDQQRRASGDRRVRRSGAEQTVLRRPDGERRNVSRS